ncbi:MAG: FAD-dependent monooxygenase [Bordetella sp.]|nr:MAG: FAD-dependent monooxygenase [Bordetella sp.]
MNQKIVVCGAGIIGMSVALALAYHKQDVFLLAPDKSQTVIEEDIYDPRVYTISPSSQKFFKKIGIWNSLPIHRINPIERMEIFGDNGGKTNLTAWQASLSQLAWVIESNQIEKVLKREIKKYGIPWIKDSFVSYQNGKLGTQTGKEISAELFIGADGSKSLLRHYSNINFQHQTCNDISFIANLNGKYKHQNTAFQWFKKDSILAFLPMPNNKKGPQISMVWSMLKSKADKLSKMIYSDRINKIENEINLISNQVLGPVSISSKLYNFPLNLGKSDMITKKIALVGDAAHSIHPLAGQGLNLGLGDSEILSDIIASRAIHEEAGDENLLKRYYQARKNSVLIMSLGTYALRKLFFCNSFSLSWLRNFGMSQIDRDMFIKQFLINTASRN